MINKSLNSWKPKAEDKSPVTSKNTSQNQVLCGVCVGGDDIERERARERERMPAMHFRRRSGEWDSSGVFIIFVVSMAFMVLVSEAA